MIQVVTLKLWRNMNIEKLERAEVGEILETSYNMPETSTEEEEDSIRGRWYEVRDLVQTAMDQFGEEDGLGNGDYSISDRASLSRGIHAEICGEKMLCPSLITEIQKVLFDLDEDFEVYLFVEAMDEMAHIFIQSKRVRGWMGEGIARLLRGE